LVISWRMGGLTRGFSKWQDLLCPIIYSSTRITKTERDSARRCCMVYVHNENYRKMQLYVAHFDVRYSNQTFIRGSIVQLHSENVFFCSVFFRVVSQPASWYLFLAKEAFIYRVAAIFPEHFQSFTVALKNHLFFNYFAQNRLSSF
jgi:hypothetical protein